MDNTQKIVAIEGTVKMDISSPAPDCTSSGWVVYYTYIGDFYITNKFVK